MEKSKRVAIIFLGSISIIIAGVLSAIYLFDYGKTDPFNFIFNNFISITRAEVAPDLKYATVYFSCIGDTKEAGEGLKKCTGMLRHHLAVTLNLRITPELRFVKDGSIEHGAKIAKFLEEIKAQEKKGEDSDV